MENSNWDVVVIGGGVAGLGAAIILGRSRRTVLVIDGGEPRNAPADGVHNYPGREGTNPLELVRIARAEAEQYGVRVETAVVADTVRTDDGRFRVVYGDREATARRLVVATGAVDVLPDVPGLAEQWGRGVVHCPYCHGWEVRDRRVGILLTSPLQTHQIALFRHLTDDLTVFVTDPTLLDDAARTRFAEQGVRFVDGPVLGVESEPTGADGSVGALTGVRTADGVVPLDAVAATSAVEARLGPVSGLGLAVEDVAMNGVRVGSVVTTDPLGRTSVPGVWAAGNVTNVATIVIAAAAAGTAVGAQLHADLLTAP
jgi:thioredoxin reductase